MKVDKDGLDFFKSGFWIDQNKIRGWEYSMILGWKWNKKYGDKPSHGEWIRKPDLNRWVEDRFPFQQPERYDWESWIFVGTNPKGVVKPKDRELTSDEEKLYKLWKDLGIYKGFSRAIFR